MAKKNVAAVLAAGAGAAAAAAAAVLTYKRRREVKDFTDDVVARLRRTGLQVEEYTAFPEKDREEAEVM